MGRLGDQSAARAAGLARPSSGRGNAAGAAKNAGASGVCEFGAALRPRARSAAPRTGRGGSPRSCEAIAAGAEAGMKDHDRWLLARKQLEGKLTGRRSSSKLPALVELILARPIASAGMIAAELGVTPRAAQTMVAELGLREMTGRGRYRAWGSCELVLVRGEPWRAASEHICQPLWGFELLMSEFR